MEFRKLHILVVGFALFSMSVHAGVHDVQPGGLARALRAAEAGDTLVLAEGRYEEPITLREKKDLRIIAAVGADVLIDGSRDMPKKWVPWKGGIWKQQVDFDLWQLFNDDALVYVARWPDATFEDGKIWRMMEGCRRTDGGWSKHKNKWLGKSRLGLAYDDQFRKPQTPGFREGDSRYLVDPSITFDNQPGSLAETGKDFTGAVAVLNIGHWLTWARPITAHSAGSDHFSYDPGDIRQKDVHQFSAYHILGLEALDRPNEWWFDSKTKTVYTMPPNGVDPNKLPLRGRVRDYGMYLTNCTDVEILGIDFHGAGFFVLNNTVLSVNRYPDPFKEEMTFSLQGFKIMHEIDGNANSLTRNNLGRMLSRSFFLEDKPKRWWKRRDGSVLETRDYSGRSGAADDPGRLWPRHLQRLCARIYRRKCQRRTAVPDVLYAGASARRALSDARSRCAGHEGDQPEF